MTITVAIVTFLFLIKIPRSLMTTNIKTTEANKSLGIFYNLKT